MSYPLEVERQVKEILECLPSESDCIEYKVEPYNLSHEKGCYDFVHDVVGLLNSKDAVESDRFIILGVSDDKYLKGLSYDQPMPDDSTFQPFISQAIRPRPRILTGTVTHDNKIFGYICISKNNTDFVYEIARDCHCFGNGKKPRSLSKGQALMRHGSTTEIMMREDRDFFNKKLIHNPYPDVLLRYPMKESYFYSAIGISVELTVAILGAWDDSYQGDKNIISKFVGEDYESWIRKVQRIMLEHPDVIICKGSQWKCISRDKIIIQNAVSLLDRNIDHMHASFITVLKYTSPKYELPLEQRIAASLYGVSSEYSSTFTKSLFELFAILQYSNTMFVHCSPDKVKFISSIVVREVLQTADWKRLVSIGWNILLLAQTSPREFINSVYHNIGAICHVFDQEEGGITPTKHGTELFTSLQMLAWDSEYIGRVSLCLAELGLHDSRSIDSLAQFLLPWYPQTNASVKMQVAIVEECVEILDDHSWVLLKQLLPRQTQVTSEIERAKYLIKSPQEKQVTVNDYLFLTKKYLEMSLALSPKNQDQIATLVDIIDDVSDECKEAIITSFANEIPFMTEKQKLDLWNKLCDFQIWQAKYAKEDRKISEKIHESISSLISLCMPKDIINQASRYFMENQWSLILKGDDEPEDEEKTLKTIQNTLVSKIWSEKGIGGIASLIKTVYRTDLVGISLAKVSELSKDSDNIVLNLFDATDQKTINFEAAFVDEKISMNGISWIQNSTIASWSVELQALLFSSLWSKSCSWQWVESQLNDRSDLYWSTVSLSVIKRQDFDPHVIAMLVANKRYSDCIVYIREAIIYKKETIDAEVVLELLEIIRTEDLSDSYSHDITYDISILIKWLQTNEKDTIRLSLVELKCFDALQDKTEAKTLFFRLSADPVFFIELLNSLYKKHDNKAEVNASVAPVVDNTFKRIIFDILHHWNVTPGVQVDGSISVDHMNAWVEHVKKESLEHGIYEVAMVYLGKSAFHSPKDSSGFFINKHVACMLNDKESSRQREGYKNAAINSRGTHWVDPSGEDEFIIEKKWLKRAKEADAEGFFLLGTTFREMADWFNSRGKENIAENQNRKIFDED